MKRFGFSICCFLSLSLWAGVDFSTTVNGVFYRGTAELSGSITFLVSENSFSSASTTEPIFISIALGQNAKLAKTLVDLASPNPELNNPIYLAASIVNPLAGVTQNVPSETVSIVRFVNGEPEIWIRIQASSDTWINNSGIFGPPAINSQVTWTIGVSARQSFDSNTVLFPTVSNLPSNSRNPSGLNVESNAASTLICTDLTSSTLTTGGAQEILDFNPIAFDWHADLGGGLYSSQSGIDTGITFSSETTIGWGRDRACYTIMAQGENGRSVVDGGFNRISNSASLSTLCETGGIYLDTPLYDGSYVQFSVDPLNTQEGIDIDTLKFSGAAPGIAMGYDPITLGGRTLYRSARLVWNGGTVALDPYVLTIEIEMMSPIARVHLERIDLHMNLTLRTSLGEFDNAPFDGNDQRIRCSPAEFYVFDEIWQFYLPPPINQTNCSEITGAAIEGTVDINLQGNEGVYDFSVIYDGTWHGQLPAGLFTLSGIKYTGEVITVAHGIDENGNTYADYITCALDFLPATCVATQDLTGPLDLGTVVTLFLDTTNAITATIDGVPMTPNVDPTTHHSVQFTATHVAEADSIITAVVTNPDGDITTCTWMIEVCSAPFIIDVADVGQIGITIGGTLGCMYTVRVTEMNTGSETEYSVEVDTPEGRQFPLGTGFLNITIPADAKIEVGPPFGPAVITVPTLSTTLLFIFIFFLVISAFLINRRTIKRINKTARI